MNDKNLDSGPSDRAIAQAFRRIKPLALSNDPPDIVIRAIEKLADEIDREAPPAGAREALPSLPEWMEYFTIPSDSGDSSYGFGNVLDNNLADRMRAYALAALAAQPAPVEEGLPTSFASQFPDLNPATLFLVWNFAIALADKLANAEKKYGYTDGWRNRDWMDECRAKLAEHIAKGDPRDVAAYCAFLWHHGESTAQPAPVVGGVGYGIIDPDYARIFTVARVLCWSEGYALTMHGSFTRDLDLVAVPWIDRAREPEHLARRILETCGLKDTAGNPGEKSHGRLVWTMRLPDFGDPRFVDFSVMPPSPLLSARPGGDDATPAMRIVIVDRGDGFTAIRHWDNIGELPAGEHFLYTHPAQAGVEEAGFYIASFRESGSRGGEVLWWMPNNAGYTPDLEQAGIYANPKPGYHDSDHTVPVPVSFIRGLRVRRTVDPGDTLNGMFWSAEKLRAAIAPLSSGAEGA